MDVKLSKLTQQVLLALKDGGPATIKSLMVRMNNSHGKSGVAYGLNKLIAKKLVKKKKHVKDGGQPESEYFINPKADLPDLDVSLFGSSSGPGSAGVPSLPEIRKIVDSLSHAIDRIRSLEQLICTPKQRAVLQAIEKTGLNIKVR